MKNQWECKSNANEAASQRNAENNSKRGKLKIIVWSQCCNFNLEMLGEEEITRQSQKTHK